MAESIPKAASQSIAQSKSKVEPMSKAQSKRKSEPEIMEEPKHKKPAAKDLWQPENARTRYSPFITRDLQVRISAACMKEYAFSRALVQKLFTPKNINRQDFTDDEYDKIIALLPAADIIYPANDDVTVLDGKPIINPQLFKSSAFNEACCRYQQDLADGKYESDYLAKAADARKRRMAGDFDNWKDEHFEVYWGQKQKLFSNAVAGASSKIKLSEMVKASVFKVGDVFSMRRHFSGGLIIRKDAIVSGSLL